MPRHSALVPLSRDHHESLLVALRLKKGGPSSPHDVLWPKEPHGQMEALIRFSKREMLPHFALEEKLIFPNVISVEGAEPIVQALISEHGQMQKMLSRLPDMNQDELPEALRQFGELLERHIRREERELFPIIESAMAEGKLDLNEAAILQENKAYHS